MPRYPKGVLGPCRTCGGTDRYPSGGCVACTQERVRAVRRRERSHKAGGKQGPRHTGSRNRAAEMETYRKPEPVERPRAAAVPIVAESDFLAPIPLSRLMAGR